MVREQQLIIEELRGRLSQLEERNLSSAIFSPLLLDSESDGGSSGISLNYREEELEAEREDEKVPEDEQEDADGKVTPANLNEQKTAMLSKTGVVFWSSTTFFVVGFAAGWVTPYFIKKITN